MRKVTTAVVFALLAWLTYYGSGYSTVNASVKKSKLVLEDVSEVSQNFNYKSRKYLNKCFKESMNLFYLYMTMSNYFDRADVALPGFQKLFRRYSDMELDNARLIMDYMNKRGSTLTAHALKKPEIHNWDDGLTALKHALKTQEHMNEMYHNVHEIVAVPKRDPHFKHFLEDNFIDSKFKIIKELKDYIRQLEEIQKHDNYPGLGLYMFDRSL